MGSKVPTLSLHSWFSWQPPSLVIESQNHFINITKARFIVSSTWRIPRVLGAGRVDEDQEYISYYKLQYHTIVSLSYPSLFSPTLEFISLS